MEKIERYIYAVTKKLPEKQRGDIEKELRSLIGDMLADRVGENEASQGDIEAVLVELGDPNELADQYREKKQYLVGPDNYDTYMLVLKIVLAAVAFGITLALTIGTIFDPPASFAEVIGGYFSALLNALFQAFAWVTVVFAIFEHYNFALGKEFKDKEWTPAELPLLPVKEAEIKPIEAIFGIVFAILALILFNMYDHLIAIYFISDNAVRTVIPLFNHEVFRSLLPLLNIMLAIGIFKELLKLVIRKWTVGLAVANMVFNLASFGLFFLFINGEGLWSEAFIAFWVDAGLVPAGADPLYLWGRLISGLIIVVAIALLIDTAVNLVKGFKYQVTK
jgi:hypothetical protein